MAKVAFIGLGVMGYPMAGHLKAKGGHDLTVYNRTAAKAEKWVAQHGGKSARTPQEMSDSPRYRGALGRWAGRAPGVCCRRSKNWTIAKPKPISETAVRSHDIMVRSRLSRVRTQAMWLSAVTLTSNLPAPALGLAPLMPNPGRVGGPTRAPGMPPLKIEVQPRVVQPRVGTRRSLGPGWFGRHWCAHPRPPLRIALGG